MLHSINLSLSDLCGADCIFCPNDKYKNKKMKIMPLEYIKKIVDEITSEEFKKHHNIRNVRVAENGDVFLNKNLIPALRYIREKLPNSYIPIFTNFQNAVPEVIDVILNEKLADAFICNIDGFSKEYYEGVKKLNYETVMENLKYFIDKRNEVNPCLPVTVQILSLYTYIKSIYDNFGFLPQKLDKERLPDKLIFNDSALCAENLKKILNPNTDRVWTIHPVSWAERNQVNNEPLNYSLYECPNISRIHYEAFISPDGDWYLCCLDANYDIIFGNVIEEGIQQVYQSEKRKRVLELIDSKQYNMVGGPCATVNCCQIIKPLESSPEAKNFSHLICVDIEGNRYENR